MPDVEIHDSVEKADRWSTTIALFVALGVYFLLFYGGIDVNFTLIIAAVSAIGVRFYIPHWASAALENPEENGIHVHPATGEYHHGAVGLALIVGPAAAVGVVLLDQGTNLALLVGGVVSVLSFPLFKTILPPE